ncbi:hypothetical protein SETIT_4G175500v2 [Setaria italica]|uniref:Uncharacterized protein n=1 Tax=Setaria italica TaxID=4555 RepID=A0A368QVT9_SETIT|nr:hypothetical protein SETIT_4G175500v2 [Setaria italica]
MQDVIYSLTDAVGPAPKQQVPEDVEATTSSTMVTFVAPELEVEIEAVEVLRVMAAGPSCEPGPSTSRAVVPLSPADSEAHADPLVAREINLEDIQLIDDPLLDAEMVARMMEMHRRIGAYAEVSFILLLP